MRSTCDPWRGLGQDPRDIRSAGRYGNPADDRSTLGFWIGRTLTP